MMADPKRKSHQDDDDSDKRRRQEEALDEALKNTFPASDPVSVVQPMASGNGPASDSRKSASCGVQRSDDRLAFVADDVGDVARVLIAGRHHIEDHPLYLLAGIAPHAGKRSNVSISRNPVLAAILDHASAV